jgi:hypothetical protein
MSQTKAQLIDPVDGTIVNADINASAAIAGSKISPNFGSQNITTTGNITSSAGEISTTNGSLVANKGTNNQVVLGHDGAVEISRNGGGAFIDFKNDPSEDHDARIQENNGGFDISGNVNIASGCDVTGAITGTGDLTIDTNTLHVDSSNNRVGIGTASPEDSLHLKSGKLRIENAIVSNNDSTISYDNADFIVDVDPNNVRGSSSFQVKIDTVAGLTIDDNRNVGIGTTNPGSRLEIRNNTATHGVLAVNRANDDAPALLLGNNSNNNALIASNNTDLLFGRDSSGTFTERMRMRNDGGLCFNGDTAAANALDDYEEGSWTATMHDGNGSNVVLTSQDNKYTKIGRLLIVTGNITLNDTGKSGGIVLTNLPFTAGGFSQLAVGHFWVDRSAPNVDTIGGVMYATASNTSAYFVNPTGGASGGGNADDRYFQFADWANGRHIYFSLTYQTA